MIRRNGFGVAALFAVALTLTATGIAKAQDGPPAGFSGGPGGRGGRGEQGGPGGPGQFDGQGRPGGQGRMPMQPREFTLANAPIKQLASALKLTDEQRGKFQKMMEEMQAQREANRPQPPAPGEEQAPPPNGGDRFAKMKAMDEKASKELEAILTDEQRRQVPELLRSWNVMRGLGLPLETAEQLKLTAEQLTVLEKSIKDHPRRPQGRGPGGPGGQDGGGLRSARFNQQGGRGGFGGPGGPGGRGEQGGPGGPGQFDGPGDMPPPPGGDNDGPGGPPPQN